MVPVPQKSLRLLFTGSVKGNLAAQCRQGIHEETAFGGFDAFMQGFLGILRGDRHGRLGQDRAGIHVGHDLVH